MNDRIQSIDIFRGMTMLLMVWVNDFWSLTDIPHWLEHMAYDEDALGFSDVIFPAFLFIVGLSIPFANRARQKKAQNRIEIAYHIIIRSASLILMGVLMVNLESYHEASAFLPRPIWQIAMALGFFLIWNVYPKGEDWRSKRILLKSAGWLVLATITALFRSDPESGYNWIEPHWWGILGLIGWSYLICALLQLFTGEKILPIAIAWIGLVLFNIASFAGWLDFLSPVKSYIWIVGDASLPALTMAGCFASLLYLHPSTKQKPLQYCFSLLALGLLCLFVGVLLRPYWGISKILATPAWTEICTGIGFVAFSVLFWIADIKKATRWASFLNPAGTATLTCYLLPYFVYAIFIMSGFKLPPALTTGTIGLATSMLFALAIVYATGILNRFKIRLAL
ncbi:heparan-alpha-glucosaminide N-acetyltransferase domain-containing protein [Pelagicoccus mobilis]|uniref:DUF5009 domain-containing protein n=1 Tax=Pelagicoccus mobilis TaxID=415221 RepID=A0A934RY07_9BACT|nr:heparan-alpha-glucosaminide N-acetyltransferase domain-containing protein [Pelagicoccus mobilis]MBK1878837.1 DUF5009 domain-containing protein [Pelagicoccus mobilis]